ncbi:MAG: VOC family protein [Alphaproteobacteria bacterium]
MKEDKRPSVWVGHIRLEVSDFAASRAFFAFIGMHEVFSGTDWAVFELRGGTHLVLRSVLESAGGKATFDLMVEDLSACREALLEGGHSPGEVKRGRVHHSFEVGEPSGWLLTFSDSHVVGEV